MMMQRLLTDEMINDEQIRVSINDTVTRLVSTINAAPDVPHIVDWFFFGGSVKHTSVQGDVDVLFEVGETGGDSPAMFLARYIELLQQSVVVTDIGATLRQTYPTLTLTASTLTYKIDLLFAVGVDGDPAQVFGYDDEALVDARHHYYLMPSDATHWEATCPPLDYVLMQPHTRTLCIYVRQVKQFLSLNGIHIDGFTIESLALRSKSIDAAALLRCLIGALRQGCIPAMYQPSRNLITDSVCASVYAALMERLYPPLFHSIIRGGGGGS